ncbi:MAG: phosphotransferase [Deltaproteobacteria bacterium]|nr:phosphotransferase [Deltaproteobacteria bacterium]
MQLPASIGPVAFDTQYRLDHDAWKAAIAEVCAAHRLPCHLVSPFADGSNLVALVDDRCVVKIFPPFHAHQWESERRVLPRLHAQLPIPVPALIAQGERDDGWFYVVVEKLEGAPLESYRGTFDHATKARLLEQIGATMAKAHALAVGELATLPPSWSAFIDEQILGCRARHARLAMPDWLVAGVDDFVRTWGPGVQAPSDHVILTGEYTPFNLLVDRDPEGWRLSGMIDLGDAMIGPRDYDLLGPSLFLCEGDPALVGALFRGYHGHEAALDDAARTRLLALAVLHRYASFDGQIRIPGWRDRARSFEQLALLIWPRC